MGYIRLDEQPGEVYHYTHRKNLDSILRDGRIRRMGDRECWFCASLGIEELEAILKNAEVVVEDEVDLDKINVGCTVKVFDITFDEEMEFKIVGSTEANSLEGKISNESPVGQALMGKKVNDVVDVETQAGVIQYKVLDIQRS